MHMLKSKYREGSRSNRTIFSGNCKWKHVVYQWTNSDYSETGELVQGDITAQAEQVMKKFERSIGSRYYICKGN